MSKYQIVKAVSFSKSNPSHMDIIDHIEKNDIDFNSETKKMWMKKLGIDEDTEIGLIDKLKSKINDGSLHRTTRYRAKKKMKEIGGEDQDGLATEL